MYHSCSDRGALFEWLYLSGIDTHGPIRAPTEENIEFSIIPANDPAEVAAIGAASNPDLSADLKQVALVCRHSVYPSSNA